MYRTYDAPGRMTAEEHLGVGVYYQWDAASRLSRITASSYDRRFLYAGAQAVGEYDSSGALIRRYVPGAGLDDYVAYLGLDKNGQPERQWPVVDPLGSVVGVTNGSATATTINTYDEYGVPGTFSGRFGYAGSMYLNRAMAAPWNMRNRQYNPTLGRFMQTDPIGVMGGINLYGYVGNDPVNLIDPWGLQPDEIPGPTIFCDADCRERARRRALDIFYWLYGESLERLLGGGRDAITDLNDRIVEELCTGPSRHDLRNLRDGARRAARQLGADRDYYGRIVVNVTVGPGGSVTIGSGVTMRGGQIVDEYNFWGTGGQIGFNVSVSANVMMSAVSPIGPATSIGANAPFGEANYVWGQGQRGFAVGGELSLGASPISGQIERGANVRFQCPT